MTLTQRIKGLTRRKVTPGMWLKAWGYVAVASFWLGAGVSFLIEGKEWALLVGLIPAIPFFFVGFRIDWSKPV